MRWTWRYGTFRGSLACAPGKSCLICRSNRSPRPSWTSCTSMRVSATQPLAMSLWPQRPWRLADAAERHRPPAPRPGGFAPAAADLSGAAGALARPGIDRVQARDPAGSAQPGYFLPLSRRLLAAGPVARLSCPAVQSDLGHPGHGYRRPGTGAAGGGAAEPAIEPRAVGISTVQRAT